MHKLLDHLNQRSFAINTVEGAEQAVRHFLRKEPQRLAHTLGVVTNMERLIAQNAFDDAFSACCLQIAYLHDVGYSSDFAFSHFHPYDGFVYLKENGWSNDVCTAVLQHTFADSLVPSLRPDLLPVYEAPAATVNAEAFTELITLADIHASSDGGLTDMVGRINDVTVRHGQDSEVAQHLAGHTDEVNRLICKWGTLTK